MNDLLHVAGWRVCARLHAQDCHRARRLAARLHVQAAEKAAANGDLFAVCLMAIANWRLSGARRRVYSTGRPARAVICSKSG